MPMLAKLNPTFVYGNYLEALLWIAIGVIAWVKRSPRTPRASLGLTIALALFGLSDLVETRTGGWYKPWWMLTWKVACVATIVACSAVVYRSRVK